MKILYLIYSIECGVAFGIVLFALLEIPSIFWGILVLMLANGTRVNLVRFLKAR